jgi:hypothetical protein
LPVEGAAGLVHRSAKQYSTRSAGTKRYRRFALLRERALMSADSFFSENCLSRHALQKMQ